VYTHFIPGIYGHLGKARAAGYARGTAPYVTHVDDDDEVTPDAFAVLRPHMERGVEAITTGERHVFENGTESDAPEAKHHLAVFRRECLQRFDYAAFRHYPDQYLLSRIQATHIPECVYRHYIRAGSGSRQLRRENAAEAELEMQAVRHPDLMVIENMTTAQIAAVTDLELSRG
jgi:hypothetical protein